MFSVREALDCVMRDVPLVGGEQVALVEAHGRVLAHAVHSGRDVPPFRNSAMDGFAVRAADVAAACREAPIRLRVLELVAAGGVPGYVVEAGTATKIMTGSPMPDGADAVVRVEDVEEIGDTVHVCVGVPAGANVRHPGEDLRVGDAVFAAGHVLRAADIGVLASLGVAVLGVRRRPEVAILSTGDELVDLGQPLGPGQIVNSNAYALAAAVEEAGGLPRIMGIVRDTPEELRRVFSAAFRSDMVLSTGGVSMGTFDLVRATLADLGVEERFWKVAQKPGKPVAFGMRDATPVFGLPGNPVSSLVCFYLYVRPALRTMLGLDRPHLPVVAAILEDDLRTAAGLTEFVRCTLRMEGNGYYARSTGSQSSGVLRSLSLGQGLVVSLPEQSVLTRGSTVRVVKLAPDAAAEPPV